MKACRYNVEKCILDDENDIHVLLVNEQRGCFIPLFLGFEECGSLIDFFNGEEMAESKLSWNFVMTTWVKLGFQPVSITIDHLGEKGFLVPTMTFLQSQFDKSFVYVTVLVPMGAAILVSSVLNVPLYLTERAESLVQRLDLMNLNEYIEEKSVKDEGDTIDEENN